MRFLFAAKLVSSGNDAAYVVADYCDCYINKIFDVPFYCKIARRFI